MIAIVILNFHTYEETSELTSSILKLSDGEKYSVYIVDNESESEKLALLTQKFEDFPNVKFVAQKDNTGFANGMNKGIDAARADGHNYIICSNSDILLNNTHDLKRLKEIAKSNQTIGVIAPQIVNLDGYYQNPLFETNPITSKFIKFIISIPLIGFAVYALRVLLRLYVLKVDRQKPNRSGFFYCPHGAFFMLTPSYFRHYKGLDANTFLYFEELILAARLRKHNLKFFLDTSLQVTHIEDVATNKMLNRKSLNKTAFILRENYKSLSYYLKSYE